jgi:hypothetical protein
MRDVLRMQKGKVFRVRLSTKKDAIPNFPASAGRFTSINKAHGDSIRTTDCDDG